MSKLKLIITLFFLSLTQTPFANTQLPLGLYQSGNGDWLETYVMDFSDSGITLEVDLRSRGRYGSMTTFLSLEDFQLLFASDETVKEITTNGFIGATTASAGNKGDQERWVEIEQRYHDDDGRLVHRKVLSFELSDQQITAVHLQINKRRQIFGIPLNMKRVFDDGSELERQATGLGMYRDNRGWPVGRVLSLVGVKKALDDPRETTFSQVCESECFF